MNNVLLACTYVRIIYIIINPLQFLSQRFKVVKKKDIRQVSYFLYNVQKGKNKWACLGIEPRTSCTRSRNHTTRPTSHLIILTISLQFTRTLLHL